MPNPVRVIQEAPHAWSATDLEQDRSWLIEITGEQATDAVDAVGRCNGRDLRSIGVEDVPLGAMEAAVEGIRAALEPGTGRGFAILRRLPVEVMTEEQATKLYWAIGLRLGEPVSQNIKGELIVHVQRDPGVSRRGYSGDAELHPHCDQNEIAALLCLSKAKSGGDSAVVSLAAVHNLLQREGPELLDELYRPFYFGRLGEQHPWERPFSVQPLFARGEDSWGGLVGYAMIAHGPTLDGVPPLTERQVAALDALKEISARPELWFNCTLEPGDVLFLNNGMVMHARTGFEDDPDDPALRRHLLRLWLDRPSPKPWPVRFDFRFGNNGLTRHETVLGDQDELRARMSGGSLVGHEDKDK